MTHSFPTRRSSDLYRRAHQYERNRSRRLAFVSPCVPVSLLHGDIAGMQLHLRSIVELQPDPALYDNVIVNGLRSMHAGTVGFEQLCQPRRSEEHTSELQSLMRISYAVFCLKKKKIKKK